MAHEVHISVGGSAHPLRDVVLLYAGNQAEVVDFGLHDAVTGVVFHGGAGVQHVKHLRAAGYEGLLLWDPETYQQPTRAQLFDPPEMTVEQQAAMEVDAVIAPSGFPELDDLDAVKKLLARGSRYVEGANELGMSSYVTLPLTPFWMRGEGRDLLIGDLEAAQLPVAVVLADRGDPLHHPEALRTLLSVIEVSKEVLVLRSDLSAVGAIAAGAIAGTIGTSSGTRHIYLPTRNSPPNQAMRGHTFVSDLLNWLRYTTLERLPASLEILKSRCEVCRGDSVARFLDAENQIALRKERELHALLSWSELARHVLEPDDRSARVARWQDKCLSALQAYEDLGEYNVDAPGFLTGWSGWDL